MRAASLSHSPPSPLLPVVAALDPVLILMWRGYDCSGERTSVLIFFEERILRRDQDQSLLEDGLQEAVYLGQKQNLPT